MWRLIAASGSPGRRLKMFLFSPRDALKSRLLGQNQASIDMRDAGLPMLREDV